MFGKGELSSEAACSHPLSHVLSQAVGTAESALDMFTRTLAIKPGEIFLLCSDGLYSIVPEGNILDIILSNPDPQQAVNRLVNLALANDGKNNITVILVHT